ncbi:MAG: hypothetical protein IKB56_00425, partial [Clostridia bacterium]|nr:hypothetical protein [Clostridia bacterium]
QRDITLTYGQDSFEYDGDINGKTITASIDEGRCDGDIITVRGDVYVLSGSEYVKTTAINAGSYIVQYTLNNSNYKIKSGYASRNLTITQYDISQANTKAQIEDIADVEYTGYEITPNVIVKFNGNQMQSENFVVSVTNNKVVGTANVTVTGKNNFKGNLYSTFTITKALLTVKFTSPTSLQYNGNVQNVTAIFEGYKANDPEIAMLISYEGSKIPKDKGTYTATVSFDGNPQNYTLSEYEKDRQHTFEITEKPIEITFSGYNGLIYNGTNRKYNATTNPDGIKVAFKDDSSIYPNDKLSLSLEFRNVSTNQIEDPTNAGTYTATAELTGDSKANYTLSKDNPTSIRFTIDKYLIDIIYNLATVSHVYSASEKKATYTISEETPLIINPTTGLEEGANIVLRYKNLDSEQTINGNPVNAGSYQIVASIGNSNYTTDTTKVQNFVIRKAPLEVSHNLVNGGVYYYEAKEINISYSYINSTGTFGGDTFSLVSTYYDATNTITDACINAGSYKVTSQLPANNVMANNYYISNPDEEGGLTHSSTFVIKPRYISVKFDMNSNNNTYYYNGLERVVTADIGENNGFIDDSEYTNNSGVMNDENEKVEAVTFLVKTYLGTVISDEYLVPYIKDKGTYTATAVLDPNNPVNVNYTIYEGDQRVYPTTSTIIINPKEIVFKSNTVNFSKTYGDNDPRFIIQLTSENTNGGLYDTDEIYVQMIRNPGETVGSYIYSGFNFVKKIVGENNNVSYETINPEDVDSNYDIQYYGNSGETDRFVINVKRISFDAQKFEFDYKTDIVNLIQEIQLNLPAIGDVVVRIKLQPINELIKNGIDAGTYDLASSFKEVNDLGDEEDNPNIECEMNEGSNKGKLIVIGRSVKVLLYNVPNDSEKDIYTFTNNTYYITYGDIFEHEDGTTSYDPDYYYGISIDYANCDPSITETTYKSYVRITREAITNSYIQGIPYKETGYTLTIDFLKFENGVYVVDKNYRAVDENGRNVNYKLFVNKFNLNNVFSNSTENKENWPVVNLEKSYDGNKSAKNDPAFTNIPEIFESHHLSVYAEYDNANAGVNKIVNVIYKFKVNDYANNYILPGDDGKLVYSEEGIINKVKLTLTFNQADYALTYGEYYSSNPNGEYEVAYPTLLYKGFVNNETPEHLNLADNIVLTYQNSQSLASIQTAGSHTIIIYDKKGVYDNYYLDCSATQSVIVSERMVTITAGATFVKTVDGTTSAEISSENYVINGIIPSDKNTTNALNVVYDAYLNSSNPGKATVIMRVKGLTGTKNENYKLPDDEDSKTILIPAIINELAVVKFDSESYSFDFDNTPKSVAPTIDESTVQENVEYILKYVGKRYDGKDYLLQTSAPKSAGVYTINCYFYHIADKNDTTKYRLLASTEMIINKITPTLYFTGNYSQTYGSFTPINATVMAPGLSQSVEVRYSFENEDGSLPTFPPAGRHTVYASYDETNDYLDVEGEQIVQIKTKTISVSFDGYKGLIYNGYTRNDDIIVTFNGIVEGDTCTPVKIYNVDEVRNAGTYRLIVTPSNSSYTISGSNSIEFTIAKKVLQVSAPSEISTTAGNTPKIELIYTGFVENEGVEDISVLPTPKISSGKVGINVIEFNEGFDENYSFNYINGVYTIVYESANEDKPNVTPYVVTGCAVGGVAIVFVLGYLVKIGNYKAITSGVAKRKIRKEMMGKKK